MCNFKKTSKKLEIGMLGWIIIIGLTAGDLALVYCPYQVVWGAIIASRNSYLSILRCLKHHAHN